MNLRAEQLPAHLAKSVAPLYTIHGDEPLLALEAADAVRAAARAKGCAEREVLAVERGFDWGELAQAGAMRSLFGGAKLVELRIPGGKPGAAGAAAIAAYCAKLDPQNVTLVSLPRLRKDEQRSEWFAALSRAGHVVDVYPIERGRLPEWIGARLARQGQRAPREVLEFIAERVEGNLLAAHQEVQKLALACAPGEVSLEAVREAVANVARYDAFDCASALLEGELSRYVRVLEGLRGEGEATTHVLWALASELRLLLRLGDSLAAGRSLEDALREQRVWGPRQALLRAAVRRHERAAVARALLHAARIDRVIKGVTPGEPWDELIRLGLQFLDGTEGAREIG
jgi:DNA polymerase-3 subunit delta